MDRPKQARDSATRTDPFRCFKNGYGCVLFPKMQLESEYYQSEITGTTIFRRVVSPETVSPVGVVLMLHGLGDHQGCHDVAAELFTKFNLACVGIDWPGNGQSEGKRGDMAGVEVAADLITETRQFISGRFPGISRDGIGVYAHSTGCFLLTRALDLGETGTAGVHWAWLSSPLVNPLHAQNWLKRKSAPIIAGIFPRLTFPTGVSRRKCVHLHTGTPVPVIEGKHKRVSARFGYDLMLHASEISHSAASFADPTRVLITQGGEDEVCPPNYSREFFDKIPASHKVYHLAESLRHEPLREPENTEFLEFVSDWLKKAIPNTPNRLNL